MKEDEIRAIFSKNYKSAFLESCIYLKDLDLYELNIDFDPNEKDPHNKPIFDSLICINGTTKEIELLHLDDYLDYNGPEITIFSSKEKVSRAS